MESLQETGQGRRFLVVAERPIIGTIGNAMGSSLKWRVCPCLLSMPRHSNAGDENGECEPMGEGAHWRSLESLPAMKEWRGIQETGAGPAISRRGAAAHHWNNWKRDERPVAAARFSLFSECSLDSFQAAGALGYGAPRMDLGRVVGTVVATRKVDGLTGVKLLLMEPLNHKREVVGPRFVAIDVVQAGPGDVVNWVASREAAMALPDMFVPVDAAIVGLVNRIDVEG